jgi:antitoxin MazE
MRVQIAKWGNSAAVRLPKPVMEQLRLKPGQDVELSIEGRELRLQPLRAHRVYRIEDLVAEMRRLGHENEPPCEDWSAVEAPWPEYPSEER